MPRTGGDYIFTSRITHPFLGWIEGWMLIWSIGATFGFNGWACIYSLGLWFKSGIVMSPGSFAIGEAINSTTSMLILGAVMFVLLAFMALTHSRRYHLILSTLGAICLASIFIQLIGLAGVTSETFAANFEKFSGMTQQGVMDQAREMGWDPTWIDWSGMLALLGYTIFGYTGASFSTYIAGELKGNIQRNAAIAMITTLGILMFTSWYILPYMNSAGYEFTNAWAYLFWNGADQVPLGGPPTTTTIAAIANPGLAWLILPVGFFLLVVYNFVALSAVAYAGVRVVFAQAMDRLYPMKLAHINERTHQPVIATVLIMIVGFIFYSGQILGYSPFAGLWYLAATAVIGYLFFPAVNVLLLKRRRPDVYELTPSWSRKKFIGVPVMKWLAAIWLAYLVPIFTIVNLWTPINSMLQMETSTLLSYAFGTGLILICLGVIIGTVYYIARRYYLSKRGIDLSMIFQAIPPE
jgi:amino acid transporter